MPASTYHVAPMPTHAHVAEKHEEVRVRTDFGHKSKPKTLQEAMKMRGDPGECLLLLRRYFDRTVDDTTGLTFKQWAAKKGELLVINSSELRAVQGHQKNDFLLRPIKAPKLREKIGRGAKAKRTDAQEAVYAAGQKFGLCPDIDRDTRAVCEGT